MVTDRNFPEIKIISVAEAIIKHLGGTFQGLSALSTEKGRFDFWPVIPAYVGPPPFPRREQSILSGFKSILEWTFFPSENFDELRPHVTSKQFAEKEVKPLKIEYLMSKVGTQNLVLVKPNRGFGRCLSVYELSKCQEEVLPKPVYFDENPDSLFSNQFFYLPHGADAWGALVSLMAKKC